MSLVLDFFIFPHIYALSLISIQFYCSVQGANENYSDQLSDLFCQRYVLKRFQIMLLVIVTYFTVAKSKSRAHEPIT